MAFGIRNPEAEGLAGSSGRAAGLTMTDITTARKTHALEARCCFGKGRYEAALNRGECCSYALAAHLGESLFHKDPDFSRADITSVPR